MIRLAVLLLALGIASRAEIAVGARGGLPTGDAFQTLRTREWTVRGRNRFLLGPTLELRLPAGFGASFDALYRRFLFETGPGSQGAAQWEFPLLMRYRFPGAAARPFVAGGPVFTAVSGVTALRNSQGLALGAGIDLKLPFFRLTPELRYSRRFQAVIVETRFGSLKANANQIDLLVGLTF